MDEPVVDTLVPNPHRLIGTITERGGNLMRRQAGDRLSHQLRLVAQKARHRPDLVDRVSLGTMHLTRPRNFRSAAVAGRGRRIIPGSAPTSVSCRKFSNPEISFSSWDAIADLSA
ncbi:hypothetical protein D3273_17390 [Lichenibacterium minor]|uniref:Uncharacterized protein n=1 Tax=Lichenibacterium minor TaxID=2316528 RepID=A0A4Q2U6R4_9HYPH|nr:hypothetical protein [Lichenibacterium minor]RYC30781.1 hypothetical protein D3273_17390 [Lichenibacterium minor]